MISFILAMLVLLFLYISKRNRFMDKYGNKLPPDLPGSVPILGHTSLFYGDSKSESQREIKSLLEQLVALSVEGALTDKEVADEVSIMIAAGFETNAISMISILATIGSYPEVQEKAYNEIKEIFGDSDRDVEKTDLPRLKYTEAVIKEVLRFYPAAQAALRYVEKDVQLQNYVLPAGSSCILFLYAMNRHPMWGKDANEFKPDRWLDPATLPENPNVFASFSIGRHNCIGGNYAMMFMKTQLVHILRRYRITADHTKIVRKVLSTVSCYLGHEILLERRQ